MDIALARSVRVRFTSVQTEAVCQIVLDASTGLAPCHAVFTIGPGLQFSIAPIDRSCAVYVIRSGTTRANQVMGATALGPNDSFTLGSINGARFFIESQQSTPLGQSRSSHARHPSQPGYATAFGQEVQRQMETRLLTKFPMYRVAHEYWYKYKTGVLSQPRNVIALVVMVLGFLGTGSASAAWAPSRHCFSNSCPK